MKTILQSPEKKSQKLKIMTMFRKDNPEILEIIARKILKFKNCNNVPKGHNPEILEMRQYSEKLIQKWIIIKTDIIS